MSQPPSQPPSLPTSEQLEYSASGKRTNVRWIICMLLLFATMINYMDRQIIGVLKPVIEKDLGWNERDYARIVLAFQLAYAFGQLIAGRAMDLFGVRIGYTVAVLAWSLFAMAHGFGRTVTGFVIARLGLGVAEGGNFPAAIKIVAEWFPKHQRSLAVGVFNSGSNMGALATPLIVPPIAAAWGWPAAFYVVGGMGIFWVVAWLAIYRKPEDHPGVSPAELAFIREGFDQKPTIPPEVNAPPAQDAAPAKEIESAPLDYAGTTRTEAPSNSWMGVAMRRTTLAYVLGGALTSPVWWFWLFWAPDFFAKRFDLNLKSIGLPLVIVYLMADVGSVGGGWLSTWLMKKGYSLNAGRKLAMLAMALCVVPVFFASQTSNQWVAVFLIGLAAAAHQGWSANLFAFGSDVTSKGSISTVVGIGGLAGGLSGMAVALLVGEVLQRGMGYTPLLITASVMYLIALAILHALVPSIENAQRDFHVDRTPDRANP